MENIYISDRFHHATCHVSCIHYIIIWRHSSQPENFCRNANSNYLNWFSGSKKAKKFVVIEFVHRHMWWYCLWQHLLMDYKWNDEQSSAQCYSWASQTRCETQWWKIELLFTSIYQSFPFPNGNQCNEFVIFANLAFRRKSFRFDESNKVIIRTRFWCYVNIAAYVLQNL